MILYSNSIENYGAPQSLQIAHVGLVFISLLSLTTIVYVHQWQIAELSGKRAQLFALKLDRRAAPSLSEKFLALSKELPALPLEFIQQNGYRRFRVSKACARFPDIFALEFHNNYWQTYRNGKLLVRLYGAYYDNRLLDQRTPVVRLLVMINQVRPPVSEAYCQIWFEHTTKPIIVKTAEYKPIWQSFWTPSTKLLYPYMVTCVLTAELKYNIPKAVSLVTQPCENAGNMLKVYYEGIKNMTSKKTFGLCVKGLSEPFSDLSRNLIEWLEVLRKFGIEKVDFNIYDVHPNVRKVLEFYKNSNYVDSKLTTISNMAVALPVMQHILLTNDRRNRHLHDAIFAHDCFYRNLYSYDYMALLDIDLVPMPLHMFNTWHAVLNYTKRQASCTNLTRICLRNVPTGGGAKKVEIKSVERDNVPTFLSNQISDMRLYFNNVTHISCWHSTNLVHFMDDQYLPKSNDCSFKLKTKLAQLQHFHWDNEQCGNDKQNQSRLTGVRSLLKQRTEKLVQQLKLN